MLSCFDHADIIGFVYQCLRSAAPCDDNFAVFEPFIDQAQSLNLFIPADVEKWDLLMLHFRAWELGIKSLYYLRSKSIQRAGFAGGVEADNTINLKQIEVEVKDYDECLACQ